MKDEGWRMKDEGWRMKNLKSLTLETSISHIVYAYQWAFQSMKSKSIWNKKLHPSSICKQLGITLKLIVTINLQIVYTALKNNCWLQTGCFDKSTLTQVGGDTQTVSVLCVNIIYPSSSPSRAPLPALSIPHFEQSP